MRHFALRASTARSLCPAKYNSARGGVKCSFSALKPSSRGCKTRRANHADDPDANPEHVKHRVGPVPPDDRAPGEHECVGCVECPDKEKGTGRAEPTDEREAKNAHQDTHHLDAANMVRGHAVKPK